MRDTSHNLRPSRLFNVHGDEEDVAPVPPMDLDPPQPVQVAVIGILGAVWVDEMTKEDVVPEGQAERAGHGRVVGKAGKAEWRGFGLGAGAGHDWWNGKIHKKVSDGGNFQGCVVGQSRSQRGKNLNLQWRA